VKQGNTTLLLLVEAAIKAQRYKLASAVSPSVHQQASRRGQGRHRPQAGGSFVFHPNEQKSLAGDPGWMLRSEQDYEQVKERGSYGAIRHSLWFGTKAD
jgi:hypothetical protein